MIRVRHVMTLAELDLDQVLGFAVSPSIAAELVGLDARLDQLEPLLRRNGWDVGNGERHIVPGQPSPIVLGRTLSCSATSDDSLELTVDVWQRDATTLLVNAAVEVYCFCPVDHNIDTPAEQEWIVRSDVELRDAMIAAVTAVEGWVELGLDADQWRARAGLPARRSEQQ